jgi:DNA-binding GntR family transcriptional regulator
MASKRTSEAVAVGSSELAYRKIRQAIIEGRYQPGQRLIEQRISEEFDLSRTPVRESLRRLDAEGLVIIERNRGAVVRPVAKGEILDLYELRSRLEALAAERAASRATAEDLAELDEAIAEFDAGLAAKGVPDIEIVRRVDTANYRFHNGLLRISANPRLTHLLARAVDMPLVFQAMRVFTPEMRARSNMFHRLIRDAVAAGEPDRAGRLMTEHILMGRDALVWHLSEAPDGLETALFEGVPEDDTTLTEPAAPGLII